MKKKIQYKAIDFFCGGGGMTYGLRQAGIDVIAGIDFDKDAKATYEYNNPHSTFIEVDIKELENEYFERIFKIKKKDDKLIFVGCSPCQFYSIINSDKTKSLKSKDLLLDFARFLEYYKPGYLLVENVPGITTNKESILPDFLNKLKNMGYKKVVHKVVDMGYYGVPQHRRRFSLIATRLKNMDIRLPSADKNQITLDKVIGEINVFPKVIAGHRDNTDFNLTVAVLSDISLRWL